MHACSMCEKMSEDVRSNRSKACCYEHMLNFLGLNLKKSEHGVSDVSFADNEIRLAESIVNEINVFFE
jgi:hypothetical protein